MNRKPKHNRRSIVRYGVLWILAIFFFASTAHAINLQPGFDTGALPASLITTDCKNWSKNLSCAQANQQAVDDVVDQLSSGGGSSSAGSTGDLQDNNGSGGLGASHLNDDGSRIYSTEKVGIGVSSPLAGLDVGLPITASSGYGYGTRFAQTLTANASSNVLAGIYSSPTFVNGSYASVLDLGAWLNGNVLIGGNNTGVTLPKRLIFGEHQTSGTTGPAIVFGTNYPTNYYYGIGPENATDANLRIGAIDFNSFSQMMPWPTYGAMGSGSASGFDLFIDGGLNVGGWKPYGSLWKPIQGIIVSSVEMASPEFCIGTYGTSCITAWPTANHSSGSTNDLQKNNGSGGFAASGINDDGTTITTTEGISAGYFQSNTLSDSIGNPIIDAGGGGGTLTFGNISGGRYGGINMVIDDSGAYDFGKMTINDSSGIPIILDDGSGNSTFNNFYVQGVFALSYLNSPSANPGPATDLTVQPGESDFEAGLVTQLYLLGSQGLYLQNPGGDVHITGGIGDSSCPGCIDGSVHINGGNNLSGGSLGLGNVYIGDALSSNGGISFFGASAVGQQSGNLITGLVNLGLFDSSTSSRIGSATLVSGTKAITISGLTASNKAFVQLVSPGGTLGVMYKAVCTTSTLTITSVSSVGTTVTTDTSFVSYVVF